MQARTRLECSSPRPPLYEALVSLARAMAMLDVTCDIDAIITRRSAHPTRPNPATNPRAAAPSMRRVRVQGLIAPAYITQRGGNFQIRVNTVFAFRVLSLLLLAPSRTCSRPCSRPCSRVAGAARAQPGHAQGTVCRACPAAAGVRVCLRVPCARACSCFRACLFCVACACVPCRPCLGRAQRSPANPRLWYSIHVALVT